MQQTTLNIEDEELQCPNCKNSFLHHSFVQIFERVKEDGESNAIQIDGINSSGKFLISMSENNQRNPSARRDGIIIGFWCECCSAHIEMHIAQHKGCTELWMQHDPAGRLSETVKF